jgi:hypothetical protein
VKPNDANPDQAQTGANLTAVGDIAGASLGGTTAVSRLVATKAIAAIDTVSAFAPADVENTGPTTDLTGSARIRTAVDLYTLLFINAIEASYGISVKPYQSATGSTVLSSADLATLLGNRIDAAPGTAGIQELKGWMALLSNTATALHGTIGPEYASTTVFTDFPTFGAAVKARNSSYPLADIGKLVATGAALQTAP